MEDRWTQVRGFMNYSVSEYGEVRNDRTGRMLKQTLTNDRLYVSLVKNGRQFHRQLSGIVARSWWGPPPRLNFDSVVHLDGDKLNCTVGNLMWRPRWFALAYHKEWETDKFSNWDGSFLLIETEEVFFHPRDCAMKYGFLQVDIVMSILNGTSIFPEHERCKWF